MMMNNGHGTRAYSPVPAISPKVGSAPGEAVERVKDLLKHQIHHRLVVAMTLSDMSEFYSRLGLHGHCMMLKHKAQCAFEDSQWWQKYHTKLFNSGAKISMNYESRDLPKSMDDLHSKLYEMEVQNRSNIEDILRSVTDAHIYADMKYLLDEYQKCEKVIDKMEAKMKRAKNFGYDPAYILEHDHRLKEKYCKEKKTW